MASPALKPILTRLAPNLRAPSNAQRTASCARSRRAVVGTPGHVMVMRTTPSLSVVLRRERRSSSHAPRARASRRLSVAARMSLTSFLETS